MPPNHGRFLDILGLILALVACYAIAAGGTLPTAGSLVDWYPTLRKPSFNPPNWIFGPVWSVLYTMMAISAWIVWRSASASQTRVALAIFGVHLLLNLAWSLLFFGLHKPGMAFAEIVLLWLSIAATIVAFWRITPIAGAMLLPYLGWVTFASALNFAIWRLNS